MALTKVHAHIIALVFVYKIILYAYKNKIKIKIKKYKKNHCIRAPFMCSSIKVSGPNSTGIEHVPLEV